MSKLTLKRRDALNRLYAKRRDYARSAACMGCWCAVDKMLLRYTEGKIFQILHGINLTASGWN